MGDPRTDHCAECGHDRVIHIERSAITGKPVCCAVIGGRLSVPRKREKKNCPCPGFREPNH